MAKETIDGVVAFYVSIRVSVEDMRDWTPERIAAFFDGLARAKAAVEGRDENK